MECKYCILQAAILGIFTFARGQHEPFRSLPEDTIALLGSEALLNCSFTSPQPGWVKWSKGTTLVSTHKLVDPLFTGKYKIEGGFEEYNLRIYNISRNDRDSYACFVGDEADNITAKADLYVLGKIYFHNGHQQMNASVSVVLFLFECSVNCRNMYWMVLMSNYRRERIDVTYKNRAECNVEPSYTVVSGDNVTAKCSVDLSEAAPSELAWYQNGVEVSRTPNKANIFTTFLNKTDNGAEFKCQVEHHTLLSTQIVLTSCSMTMDVQYGPSLRVNGSREWYAVEGQSYYAHCDVDANPEGAVFWEDTMHNIIEGEILLINAVARDQRGIYTCYANNSLFNGMVKMNSAYIDLDVQYPPLVEVSAPRFSRESENVTLNCSVTEANPNTEKITWLKNGVALTVPVVYTIMNITREFTGYYSCTAVNTFHDNTTGSGSHTIYHDVQYPPTLTVVDQNNGTVIEGYDFTSNCSADANPKANITWKYPNGFILHESQLHFDEIHRNRTGTYTCSASNRIVDANPRATVFWEDKLGVITSGEILELRDVQREDHGNYSCFARNSFWNGIGATDYDYIILDVQYPPDVTVSIPTVSKEGENITLMCRVEDANPTTDDVTWIKDGVNLHNPAVYEMTDITRLATGNYTCTAINTFYDGSIGIRNVTYHLNVQYPPSITVNNQNSGKVIQGNTFTASCAADANPQATITWTYPSGQTVEGSQLTFTEIGRRHTGMYTCKAFNILYDAVNGSAEETIYVDVQSPPSVSVNVSSEWTVIEGSSYYAYCNVDANPLPTVYWEDEMHDIIAGAELKINVVKRDQHGIYTCYANNTLWNGDVGTDSDYIKLDVQYPALLEVNVPLFSKEGMNVIFNCSVTDANPVPNSITWLRDGVNLNVPAVYEIVNINREFTGYYTCTAVNILHDNTIRSVNYTSFHDVQYPPTLTVLDQNNGTVIEGYDFTSNCSADANPNANITWKYPNGFILHESQLHFDEVHRNRTGTYTCSASNRLYDEELGSAEQIININVQCTFSNSNINYVLRLVSHLICLCKENQYSPTVTVNASTQWYVVEGNSYYAYCNVDANPYATVYWKHDLSGIIYGERLEIHGVQRQDNGNYTCCARNTFWNDIDATGCNHIILDVQYSPNVTVSMPTVSKEGENITLMCRVEDANPTTDDVIWFKDGVNLHIPTVYEMTDITRLETGNYTCTAINTFYDGSIGIYNVTHHLNVQYLPSVSVTMPEIAKEGSDVTLSCSVEDANPMVENIAWFKNGIDLGVTSLFELINVPRNASGNYTCSAVNILYDGSVGSENITKYLDIQYPPSVKLSMPEVVKEGDNISMTCLVLDANPMAADITWYKDGVDLHIPGVYTIMDITRDSTGIYTCTATNTFHDGSDGTTSASNYLNVQCEYNRCSLI
ncbi:hemicentin-1-like [Saccoglossus kowalevskii]